MQTWNTSDDAAYWAEQAREMTEPVDPVVALQTAEDQLSRYRFASDPALQAMVPELEATIARLRPIVDAIPSPLDAKDGEWTREVTIERRQAWNDAVRSGRYTTPSGKPHVANIIKAVGFHMDDLKHYIAHHGL